MVNYISINELATILGPDITGDEDFLITRNNVSYKITLKELDAYLRINEDDKLSKSENLNDLENKEAARLNLGVYSKEEINENLSQSIEEYIVPLGTGTSGDYIKNILAGNGINILNGTGEGSDTTISISNVGTAGTYTKVITNERGQVVGNELLVPNDIPNLDASKITSGIIPAERLPSFVDDVLEFVNLAGFPTTGETGKIYIALDTNKTYRWSGSTYVYITSGAVDSVAGRTGVVTLVKDDVGLGNVDNTSDANKPVSTATQTALNLKANAANAVLTGIPVAPTAAVGTSTTQLATTEYVRAEIASDLYSKVQLDAGQLDNRYYTEAEIDAILEAQNDASEISYDNTVSEIVATNVQDAVDQVKGSVDILDNIVVKLTGNQTIAGVKTFSSTISGSINGNAATATKLATARTIGEVSFDGSANIDLPGVNTVGNQNTTGNAATATKLATARTINEVSFDGTANIEVLSRLGTNIASAATTNIGTTGTKESVHITGTTTITSLGTGTTGTIRTVIFDDSLTLIHNASKIIFPSAVDVITNPGDVFVFLCEDGANAKWRCLSTFPMRIW